MILRRICQLSLTRITHQVSRAFVLNLLLLKGIENMNKKMISFIGGGNMATAIISGILSSGLSDSDHICATAAHESSVIRLKETLHIEATTDNKAAAQKADILFWP